MRLTRPVGLAVAALAASLTPVTVQPATGAPTPTTVAAAGYGGAHGVKGCRDGKVYRYVFNPSKDIVYHGAADEYLKQRETGIYHTWQCRRPGRDKIKFKRAEGCWTWITDPEWGVFHRTRMHLVMFTDGYGSTVTRGNFDINKTSNGQIQACRVVDVPLDDERWQYIKDRNGTQNAFMRFGGAVERSVGFPDVGFHTRRARPVQPYRNGIYIGPLR